MKKIIFIYSLLALALVGCEKENGPIDTISDFAFTSSIYPGYDYEANQCYYAVLSNLSQGCIDAKWTIDEGCDFMVTPFDEDSEDLSQYVDTSLGKISTNETIFVYFRESGIRSVNLHATFNEEVKYNSDEVIIESTLENGIWVIDHTFEFDVFAPIEPAFKVYKFDENGTEELILDIASDYVPEDGQIDETVELMVGDKLKFVDLTTIDRPEARSWSLPNSNAVTTTDSAAVVSYYKMGTHIGHTFTSSRGRESVAASTTKFIPLEIIVKQSTAPFEILSSVAPVVTDETSRNVIRFQLSGEIGTIGDTAKEDFTVSYTNTSGATGTEAIASVAKSASDATCLEITLLNRVYNSDAVTISYDETNKSIQSADFRDLHAFSDVEVEMTTTGIWTTYGGFELNDNAKSGWWIQPAYREHFDIVSDFCRTGTSSLWVEFADPMAIAGNMQATATAADGNFMQLEANTTYTMKCWVYVDSSTGGTDDIKFSIFNSKCWLKPLFSVPVDVKDEWIELSGEFTTPASMTVGQAGDMVRIFFTGANLGDRNVKFWIDDADVYPVEPRE